MWLNELEGMEGRRTPQYKVVSSLKEYDEFFRWVKEPERRHVILLCSPEKF